MDRHRSERLIEPYRAIDDFDDKRPTCFLSGSFTSPMAKKKVKKTGKKTETIEWVASFSSHFCLD